MSTVQIQQLHLLVILCLSLLHSLWIKLSFKLWFKPTNYQLNYIPKCYASGELQLMRSPSLPWKWLRFICCEEDFRLCTPVQSLLRNQHSKLWVNDSTKTSYNFSQPSNTQDKLWCYCQSLWHLWNICNYTSVTIVRSEKRSKNTVQIKFK